MGKCRKTGRSVSPLEITGKGHSSYMWSHKTFAKYSKRLSDKLIYVSLGVGQNLEPLAGVSHHWKPLAIGIHDSSGPGEHLQ